MTRITAIIAEDEEPQRLELAGLLRDLWPDLDLVAVCADGLEALEAVTAHRPTATAWLPTRPSSSTKPA